MLNNLNCLEWAFNIFDNKISTYLYLPVNAFPYPSFDKHFLLCPNMTRAVYFYELVFTYGNQTLRYETYNQNIAYCIIGIRYLPGNFRGIWKTHSLMESMVMGIYESKFVVLKHFGCDVSPKKSAAPFLFTIYILKRVFCKDNSVEYAFDRCVQF